MWTQQILLLHSLVVGSLLVFWMYWLIKKDLFRWTTAGFWAWVSFALYFVLNPFLNAISSDYLRYEINLTIAGEEARAAWIGLVICVGISVFYLVYFRSQAAAVTWQLKQTTHYPPTLWYFMVLCFIVGLPALLTFRVGLFGGVQDVLVDQGRFIGEVTGYQYSAHTFLLVPAVFMILVSPKLGRLAGWAILVASVLASFTDPWSRFLAISTLIAGSLIDALSRSKRWPRVGLVILTLFTATVLWMRGHSTFTSRTEIVATAVQAPINVMDTLSSGDAAMLATFYLESYTRDTLAGFDYGIPLVNYSLTGLLPSRFFPWKYFLIDQLRDRQDQRISTDIQALLYGSKSSLIGSFYTEGGLLAVVLLMAMAGLLSRKLDGMLYTQSPPLVRATAVVWMSLLWMIWGSADYWALTMIGLMALPTIGLWLLSPKTLRRRAKRMASPALEPATSAPASTSSVATR